MRLFEWLIFTLTEAHWESRADEFQCDIWRKVHHEAEAVQGEDETLREAWERVLDEVSP